MARHRMCSSYFLRLCIDPCKCFKNDVLGSLISLRCLPSEKLMRQNSYSMKTDQPPQNWAHHETQPIIVVGDSM